MAVSLYFGLPGCGKTTMLAKIALDAVKSGKYKNVYSNVGVNIPGVTIIDNECIGKYELRDCLILIDEATIFADSRDYKNFSRQRMEYFLTHRHYNADIILFTQRWDAVDLKIRSITDRVYYIRKGFFLGRWISTCWRIPYDIIIPDPKRGGDKLGEIIQGYCKPNILVRLFAKRVFRPAYYQYFDSWEVKEMDKLPHWYSPIQGELAPPVSPVTWYNKRNILLRSLVSKKYSLGVAPQRTHTGPLLPGPTKSLLLWRVDLPCAVGPHVLWQAHGSGGPLYVLPDSLPTAVLLRFSPREHPEPPGGRLQV